MRQLALAFLFPLVAVAQPPDFPDPKIFPPDEATLKAIKDKTAVLKKVTEKVNDPITDPDVLVYLKAAEWIVKHGEWYTDKSAQQTLDVLDAGLERLKTWVRGGGTLVTMGSATAWAAEDGVALTTARRMAAEPESSAPKSEPAPAKPATPAAGAPKAAPPPRPSPTPSSPETRDRLAEELIPYQSTSANNDTPESVPGIHADVLLDRTHWLTAGYDAPRLTVLVEGDLFLRPSKDGENSKRSFALLLISLIPGKPEKAESCGMTSRSPCSCAIVPFICTLTAPLVICTPFGPSHRPSTVAPSAPSSEYSTPFGRSILKPVCPKPVRLP